MSCLWHELGKLKTPPMPKVKPASSSSNLRDQFAMAALTGLLANPRSHAWPDEASRAYEYADAMLEAREAKEGA